MNACRAAVVQDGARLHYALPLALQKAGALERVFTDWYSAPGSVSAAAAELLARVSPALGEKLRTRFCHELDGGKVIANPWLNLRNRLGQKRHPSPESYFIWESNRVARWILRRGFGDANALLGFVRNISPIACKAAREEGLRVIGDQMIAPAAVELAEHRKHAGWFPDWEKSTSESFGLELMAHREEETWRELDHITCASDYVRGGLIGEGVESERITVIPYPIDAGAFRVTDRSHRPGPVTVGFVGGVNLRKGAPYFFWVASRFKPASARFVMVGAVALTDDAIQKHKGNVELIGALPRSEISSWLERFDIFFFPSTCEGSSGAVMEAMASGLPVVTTPNSGTLVRDGSEGFVAPYDDVDQLTTRLGQLVEDRELRLKMGAAARCRAEEFGLLRYGKELIALLESVLSR